MTQRRFARLSAMLIALILVLCCLPAGAAGSVDRVTVTFCGDPATSRGFTWYTAAAVNGSDLEVTLDSGTPMTFTGQSGLSSNDSADRWHKAVATGLSADTRYRFRVGDAASGLWSDWGSFKTAGSGGFTFICLTDTQAAIGRDADISANTLAVAKGIAPDAAFVVHSGDVVDKGLDESLWRMTLNAAQADLLHTTLVPAAGNHERSGHAFDQHFNLAAPLGSDTQSGAYYSFTYGPVHVVTLNTNEPSGSIANLSDSQVAWLKEDITAARQGGALRVVVNLHKGMYSLGPYATDAGITGKKGQRTLLSPLLETLEVDLVLQGHDHFPSRTYPLLGAQRARLGVTYLNTGTAGVKAYSRNQEVSQSYLDRFAFVSATTPSYTRYQNFAVIAVDSQGNMSGIFYQIDQKADPKAAAVIDRFDLPTPVNRLGVLPYQDIGGSEAFAPAVEQVTLRGIMEGVSATAFDPESQVNRAMLVTLLHRLAGEPTGSVNAGFSDVPVGQWYTQAVNWSAHSGVVSGYGDGTFGPMDPITREQLAAVLFRYAGSVEKAGARTPLEGSGDQALVAPYAREAMSWAAAARVVPVRPDGRLEPRGKVTRAEAAQAMAALLHLIEG